MRATVAFVLPSFAGGGAERVALTLAAHLDRGRFAPVVVVLDPAGPLAAMVPDDTPVHALGVGRLRRALPGLVAALRRMRPQVVFSTLGYVNIALLASTPLLPRRLRMIVREANMPSRSLAAVPAPALFRLGYRLLYPRAERVLCPSRAVADELARHFWLAPAKLTVLPSPVDAARLRRLADPPRRHAGPGVRLVAAGRLTGQKGFDRLLDLFAALPPTAHLTILGEGPDRAALESQVERLGLAGRVALAGFDPTPWPIFAGADAFVLSSRWEGMANAALEALACGTPVIAAPEAGGIGELAAEAPAGAVTLAPWGAPFARAMGALTPTRPARPRPSLLPTAFALPAVMARFHAILAGEEPAARESAG